MSQMGGSGSQKIGGVHVEVNAFGTEQATRKVSGFAASVKSATKPLRDMVGALVGAVGAFTRILGLIGLVTGAIYGAVKAVSAFWDWLVKLDKRLKDLPSNLQAVIDKHAEYLAVLEKIQKVQAGPGGEAPAAKGIISNVDQGRIEADTKRLRELDLELEKINAERSRLGQPTPAEIRYFDELADEVERAVSPIGKMRFLDAQAARVRSQMKPLQDFLQGVMGRGETVENVGFQFETQQFYRKVFLESQTAPAFETERIVGALDSINFQLEQLRAARREQ